MEEKVESLLKPIIENLGYELYDVIYEKEAKDYYLRIFIDKPEGISLEDCETVNNAISDILDEANYIKEQYFLEVSSPGVERLLRKEKHLKQSIGKEITVNLFKPINLEKKESDNFEKNKKIENSKNKLKETNETKKKQETKKQINGILKDFNKEYIILNVENQEITIETKNIANIKLKYNW